MHLSVCPLQVVMAVVLVVSGNASLSAGETAAAEPTAAAGKQASCQLVWFGTYTRGGGGSEGIYVSHFDPESGSLAPPVLATAATNPSFLAVHPTRPLLYAVAEVAEAEGRPSGAISAYSIDAARGRLTLVGSQPTGGGGPCHVCIDPSGQAVLAANYGGGSVICLGIGPDGQPQPVVAAEPGGFVQHVYDRANVAGIDPRRQKKPHAHSVDVSPDGRFAFCCDLGLDAVLVSRLDPTRATLSPHLKATLAAGSGPRHFAFHPAGRHAYCVNELALTVTAFGYDPEAGRLGELQTLSTIPDDVVDRTGISTAEVAVHPTGRFLYASNRGHHSIAMAAIDEASGKLSFLGVEPIRGQTPRSFAISPNGKFLLAAGQDSNTVTVFTIDEATGRLTFTGQSVAVPSPVCVLFGK